MKKILLFASAVALCVSCGTVSTPGVATGNIGEKTGEVKKSIWFGITFKAVNLSLEKAAENGGITKIATVDYSVKGVFKKTYKVIVTGS